MPTDRLPRYDFRAATADDMPTLGRWLAEPHVARWWGDPEEALSEIGEAMESIETEALIVEMDGEPIGYLQSYDPHLEDDHPYQDQPTGTLGVDLSIGRPDLIGLGHGPAILRQFVEILFAEGAPRVVIDPDPANAQAIRAYQKAGFAEFDRRTTHYGPAVMMKRDAPEEI
jgi:aminoglycoside 6'-N-acetyltransferase